MEILDIVNQQGQPIGLTIDRETAHLEGVRHRTSHVWILRKKDDGIEVLLQKRSANKDSFPGCYDISSAGHIPAGVDFVPSALRELKEELGLDAQPEELIYCGQRSFSTQNIFRDRPFWNRQVSNVYALWRDVEPEALTLQAEEVESVLWYNLGQCLRDVANHAIPNCVALEELELVAAKVEI
ncbi:MAG: NUDIX domain-containing protein [Oscillospiraceae bacterium]|nr:NUDIX domain-containing protein [Oscillospiraceae bacterium]